MVPLDPEIEAKYEFLGRLGEGGRSTVYKVRQRKHDEIRVMKTVNVSDESEKERFFKEARRGYAFEHRGLVRVFDYGITNGGTAWMSMEFVDGLNLRQVLANAGSRLETHRVVDITLQTLAALAYLHERGIVHRDISPDNIMLTTDEANEPVVKLIDLGIAKSLKSSAMALGTKFAGKATYASPEQLEGKLDPRGDLYSVGIMMYELLTGVPPVRSTDYRAIMAAHLAGELRSFDETDPQRHIPEKLRGVILHALRRDPAQRFQSAAEFANALRASGHEPDAFDDTAVVRLRK